MRCFSSPGSLRAFARSPVSRWGCPIRTPQDHRLPAPPPCVSSRGHVLHRPLAPRHPPSALLRLCLPTSSVCLLFVVRAAESALVLRSQGRSPHFACSRYRSSRDMPQPLRGGAAGIRTPDLRRARAALSQTKLRPHRLTRHRHPGGVGAPGLEPGTSALSGPRSNHLSYAPAPMPRRGHVVTQQTSRHTSTRSDRPLCRRRSETRIPCQSGANTPPPPAPGAPAGRSSASNARPSPRLGPLKCRLHRLRA